MLSSPELLQQATAFQSYLEQLQFPPFMANQRQNPTQNAQPPTTNNGHGQFPPSPQMPEQVQNMMAKMMQEQMMKEMQNQQMVGINLISSELFYIYLSNRQKMMQKSRKRWKKRQN